MVILPIELEEEIIYLRAEIKRLENELNHQTLMLEESRYYNESLKADIQRTHEYQVLWRDYLNEKVDADASY